MSIVKGSWSRGDGEEKEKKGLEWLKVNCPSGNICRLLKGNTSTVIQLIDKMGLSRTRRIREDQRISSR